MFDRRDREELLEIMTQQYEAVRDMYNNCDSFPNTMTCNLNRVGITIRFRKLYDALVCEQCGITASVLAHEDPLVGINYNGRIWICTPCDRRMEIED